MTSQSAKREEPTIGLPTARLITTVMFATIIAAGGWYAAASLGRWGAETARTGLIGGTLVGVIVLAGVLIMTPWVTRPVSAWMTLWLAGTVMRMLMTPIAAWLLYSATPRGSLAAEPLALSVALTYLATLFSEATVLALHVKRIT